MKFWFCNYSDHFLDYFSQKRGINFFKFSKTLKLDKIKYIGFLILLDFNILIHFFDISYIDKANYV